MRYLAVVAALLAAVLIWRPWNSSDAETPGSAGDLGSTTNSGAASNPGSNSAAAGPRVTPPNPPPRDPDIIAIRRYEDLLNGRRAGAFEVTWRRKEIDGQTCIEDTTRHRSRTVRDMSGHRTVFESRSESVTVRTASGELISSRNVVELGGGARTDSYKTTRTESGYHVEFRVGPNRESFDIATEGPTIVDAESFLAERIRDREVEVGKAYTMRQLDTNARRTIDVTLTVLAIEDDGVVRVEEKFENNRTLWWFDPDGSVRRMSAGIRDIRRDDAVTLNSLPRRGATFRITLPCDASMPRIFTGKSMLVDLEVMTNETVRVPEIGKNPFTEVVEKFDDRVRLRLTSHDETGATTPYPIPAEAIENNELEPFLKATRVMEVDDPRVRETARRAVGDATDVRDAARRIADRVFHMLRKQSPELGEPTAVQILRDLTGDCSEHALLFTALCRAAGIPARRCSGWVCIGDDWGAHAWCEIWVGRWIGADPTTNEIGTRARYIMLARQDEPEYRPARILAERSNIRVLSAEYGDGTVDFTASKSDETVRTGIRLDLPKGWSLRYSGRGANLTGDGVRLSLYIEPDHGYRSTDMLRFRYGKAFQFGDRTAYRRGWRSILVPLGRQHLHIAQRSYSRRELPLKKLVAALQPMLERGEE